MKTTFSCLVAKPVAEGERSSAEEDRALPCADGNSAGEEADNATGVEEEAYPVEDRSYEEEAVPCNLQVDFDEAWASWRSSVEVVVDILTHLCSSAHHTVEGEKGHGKNFSWPCLRTFEFRCKEQKLDRIDSSQRTMKSTITDFPGLSMGTNDVTIPVACEWMICRSKEAVFVEIKRCKVSANAQNS
jgi:hypothetical protein